jgi:hypothetical protein
LRVGRWDSGAHKGRFLSIHRSLMLPRSS